MTAGATATAGAAARSAAGAAGIALWLALGAGRRDPAGDRMRGCGADGEADGPTAPEPVGADENWLVRNIVCQCGTCRHNLLECESEGCGHAIQDRLRSASC